MNLPGNWTTLSRKDNVLTKPRDSREILREKIRLRADATRNKVVYPRKDRVSFNAQARRRTVRDNRRNVIDTNESLLEGDRLVEGRFEDGWGFRPVYAKEVRGSPGNFVMIGEGNFVPYRDTIPKDPEYQTAEQRAFVKRDLEARKMVVRPKPGSSRFGLSGAARKRRGRGYARG
jgi:hypothetical protein